jgi:transcriptional regulator with XRE-family HTH domain
LGLTQEALAVLLGVAPSALQKYEQGRNTIKTTVLNRMHRAQIDVNFVVFGRDREALEPLDAALWERIKAWDIAHPNDADGNPLNEYARFQRVTLFYRWLRERPSGDAELEDHLNRLSGQKAA